MNQAGCPSVPDNGSSSRSNPSTASSSSVEDESRRKFKIGDMVLALWSGEWYCAEVLEEDVGPHPETGLEVPCYLIHYPGYAKRFDEYVMEDSLMLQTPENRAMADAENLQTNIGRSTTATSEKNKPVTMTNNLVTTSILFLKQHGRPPKQLTVRGPKAGVVRTPISPTQQTSTSTRLSPAKRPNGSAETVTKKRADPVPILPNPVSRATAFGSRVDQPLPGSGSAIASGTSGWSQGIAELQNVLKSISMPPTPVVPSLEAAVAANQMSATPPRILMKRADGEVIGKISADRSVVANGEPAWPALRGSATGNQRDQTLPASVSGAGSSSGSRSGMEIVEQDVISGSSSNSSSSGENSPQVEHSMEVEYLGSTIGNDGLAAEGNDGSAAESCVTNTTPIVLSEADYCSNFFLRTSNYERARFCLKRFASQKEARGFIRELNQMLLVPFVLTEREEAVTLNDSLSGDSGISDSGAESFVAESAELPNVPELGQPGLCAPLSITPVGADSATPLIATAPSQHRPGPSPVPVVSSLPAPPLMPIVYPKPGLTSTRSSSRSDFMFRSAVRGKKAVVNPAADLASLPDPSHLSRQLPDPATLQTPGTAAPKPKASMFPSKTPTAVTRILTPPKGAGPVHEKSSPVSILPEFAPVSHIFQEPAPVSQVFQESASVSQVFQKPAPVSQVFQEPAPVSQEPATAVPAERSRSASSSPQMRPRAARSHSAPPASTTEDLDVPGVLFPCAEPGCRYAGPENLRALNLDIGEIHTHRAKTIRGTFIWRADVQNIDSIRILAMGAVSVEAPIKSHVASSAGENPPGSLSGTSAFPMKSMLQKAPSVQHDHPTLKRIWFCENKNEINEFEASDTENGVDAPDAGNEVDAEIGGGKR